MSGPIDSTGWRVMRIRHDQRRLRVVLPSSGAPVPWIARLVRLVPKVAARRPAELLDQVRRDGGINFGVMPGREAWRLTGMLEAEGFEVVVADATETSYFAIHETMGGVMNDDGEDNEAFCLRLIEAGAPVEDVEE